MDIRWPTRNYSAKYKMRYLEYIFISKQVMDVDDNVASEEEVDEEYMNQFFKAEGMLHVGFKKYGELNNNNGESYVRRERREFN